jgi:hypothetical protein
MQKPPALLFQPRFLPRLFSSIRTANGNAPRRVDRLGVEIALIPAMRLCYVALVVSWVFACLESPARTFAQAKADQRTKQLENEKRKLDRTKDPANRAKSLMRTAEILLTYVNDAANDHDPGKLKSTIDQYHQTVKDARDTMMKSGLDPHKKSGGYRAVEIVLRKQLRVLQDISRQLSVDERPPVEETIESIMKIRDEFMSALFGIPIDVAVRSVGRPGLLWEK